MQQWRRALEFGRARRPRGGRYPFTREDALTMDTFTAAELRELLTLCEGPCISIYMPTHRTGREIREDALRLKNLLSAAEKQLLDRAVRRPDVEALLKQARNLQLDGEFWKAQGDGLALFLCEKVFRHYRLPLKFDETLVVAGRFYIKPILAYLQSDTSFYVLAASQNKVRLLRGTRHSISELTLQTLPRNLREALNIDEYVEALQYHTAKTFAGGPTAGRGEVMYHGHGGGDPDLRKKIELSEYFRLIDRGLQDYFQENRAPLVFAGVDYLFPIFRKVSGYRGLVDSPVTGNPDQLNPQQLHEKAWTVIAPLLEQSRRADWDKLASHVDNGLASYDLAAVVAAARTGRVESLFVAGAGQSWGHVDEAGGVTLAENPAAGAVDLLDDAAVHTLLARGKVYVVAPGEELGRHAIAASFRYSL